MREQQCDALVIGGGAAGMAAALALTEQGLDAVIVEREEQLGGILLQCIHNGFGLHTFGEELTGPEYASRYIERVSAQGIAAALDTTVLSLRRSREQWLVHTCSRNAGVTRYSARSVVLAMGCRERNRGNLGIPGTRPAGVFTAGLVQRLCNIEGLLPGRRAVIIGSGDIGLIMARRLTWLGMEVAAVVEIMPYPSGLIRNVVQCLRDYDIPLYLKHMVSAIRGHDRVEGVEVTPLKAGKPEPERAFSLDCDTVLIAAGLIPENELSRDAGVVLNRDTGGPLVDGNLMTNQPALFACGNVLHVHDTVDFVSEEGDRCARAVVEYLDKGGLRPAHIPVRPGANVRYVVPNRCRTDQDTLISLRSLVLKRGVRVVARVQGRQLSALDLDEVRPSEMIRLPVSAQQLAGLTQLRDPLLEISVEGNTP